MNDMPQGAAVLRPWTVKAMPEDLTQRAAAAARRRQETVAELVSRALARELDNPTWSAQPLPSKPTERSAQLELSKLDELVRLIDAAAKLAECQDRLPKRLAGSLRQRLREAARNTTPIALQGPDSVS